MSKSSVYFGKDYAQWQPCHICLVSQPAECLEDSNRGQICKDATRCDAWARDGKERAPIAPPPTTQKLQ